MIHIGKGKLLEFRILCFSQVRAQPLTRKSRKLCAPYSEEKSKTCTHQHPGALPENILPIPGCDSDIHDICHDQRNQKLKK